MRITEKQLIVLVEILKYCLGIYGGISNYPHETLVELYTTIINQQSDKLIEVKDDSK